MMRPDASVLEAESDRCDRAVGLIERARDCVKDAIGMLEEAAKESSEAAEDCAESAEELRVVLHDFIQGNALHVAREAANTARLASDASYPQDDVAGWLAAASRHAAE